MPVANVGTSGTQSLPGHLIPGGIYVEETEQMYVLIGRQYQTTSMIGRQAQIVSMIGKTYQIVPMIGKDG